MELLPVVCIVQGDLWEWKGKSPRCHGSCWRIVWCRRLLSWVCLFAQCCFSCDKTSPNTGGGTPFIKPFSLDPSTLFHECPWILSLSGSYQGSPGQLRQVGIITGPPGSFCVCVLCNNKWEWGNCLKLGLLCPTKVVPEDVSIPGNKSAWISGENSSTGTVAHHKNLEKWNL